MRYSIFGYLIGEGFRNVFKNKKSTVASLIIMCATMFIFGIFFVLSANINHITENVKEQQGMEVFIEDDATQEQITELENYIRNIDYVNTITFKSKEQALDQVKKWFKGMPDLINNYEKNNPFRASYVVTLTQLEHSEEVKNKIEEVECVYKITIGTDTINKLISIADGIKIVSAVIIIIIIFISIFIITNTIKLTVHARRKEISIMKYVGATNGFIRWPFMVEGMIIGVISVLISMGILALVYNSAAQNIAVSISNARIGVFGLLSFQDMFSMLIIVYLALGMGIGAIGSAISMKKYLEV